jgi:hypothetical protein
MIDNKTGITNYLENNGEIYQVRIDLSKNPKLYAYAWEQKVTNGLGYLPVRKVSQETKTHTTKGLREHLKNMEHILFERRTVLREALFKESHKNRLLLEDSYKRIIEKLPGQIEEALRKYHQKP